MHCIQTQEICRFYWHRPNTKSRWEMKIWHNKAKRAYMLSPRARLSIFLVECEIDLGTEEDFILWGRHCFCCILRSKKDKLIPSLVFTLFHLNLLNTMESWLQTTISFYRWRSTLYPLFCTISVDASLTFWSWQWHISPLPHLLLRRHWLFRTSCIHETNHPSNLYLHTG